MTLNQTGKHYSFTEFKPISLAYMVACSRKTTDGSSDLSINYDKNN